MSNIFDEAGLFSELPPKRKAAPDKGAVSHSRTGRRIKKKRQRRPFNVPGDKPKNNFARDWLAFNFGLDGLLGRKAGDLRYWYNKGFSREPTRRFVKSLRFEEPDEDIAAPPQELPV